MGSASDDDAYFLGRLPYIAARGGCDRKRVACLLVDPETGDILGRGRNTSLFGLPTCDQVGHLLRDNHCRRSLHAEVAALADARLSGDRLVGATAYLTVNPCYNCFNMLVLFGVERIVFAEAYPGEGLDDVFQAVRDLRAAGYPIELVGPGAP